MKLLLSLFIAVLLTACTGGQLQPAQTFPEKVAYVEAGTQGAIKTLADLTCIKYTQAGVCTDASRPLHPERSKGYLESLSKVRLAIRAAATMGPVGTCLGQPSTPLACLGLATSMLGEIQTILNNAKKGGV